MDPRRLEMTVLMTPDMANFSGKVHGGALLNLLDRVAFSLRLALLRPLRRHALGRSGDLQGADQRRRARHLPRQRQPCRPHLDGDRDPGRGGEHPHRHRPPHQLLLLHHGRRRRRRPARRGAGRSASSTAAEARRNRAAELRRKLRREIAAEMERAAGGGHERLVLGRHRPGHRPRRLRPPRRHRDRRRHRRRRRLHRPAVRAARRLRPHRDRAGGQRAGDLRRPHLPEPRRGRSSRPGTSATAPCCTAAGSAATPWWA